MLCLLLFSAPMANRLNITSTPLSKLLMPFTSYKYLDCFWEVLYRYQSILINLLVTKKIICRVSIDAFFIIIWYTCRESLPLAHLKQLEWSTFINSNNSKSCFPHYHNCCKFHSSPVHTIVRLNKRLNTNNASVQALDLFQSERRFGSCFEAGEDLDPQLWTHMIISLHMSLQIGFSPYPHKRPQSILAPNIHITGLFTICFWPL